MKLLGLILAVAGLIPWLVKPHAVPRTSGAMRSACYVWQRVWDDAVKEAVRNVPAPVVGLAPLCAEISWDEEGRASAAWPELDGAALRKSGRPVSAVLRIESRTPTAQTSAGICKIAAEVMRRLRAGGIEPKELQVDFDCAESQLRGYRACLAALRSAVAPLPVRPTVLPSWLASREFRALAGESGGYILQVHATKPPRIDASETALCETEDARRWVEQAGRIGVPFRVALPTYTYRVAFAPDGRLLGIEAEGEPRVWPPGSAVRYFRPDPARLAALIGDWNKDRPSNFEGLIWYRLPVSTDVRNWRWPTLAAVMEGRAPRVEICVEQSGASPTDLVLVNKGEADAPLPVRIVATSAGAVADADGVGGYRAEISGKDAVFLRGDELAAVRIPPGMRHSLGWLRADSKIQIQLP